MPSVSRSAQGFHQTSLDAVAAEAGFTKGRGLLELRVEGGPLFAVYERRVDERVAEVERAIQAAPTVREGIERIIPGTGDRPAASDGWLAVFFEFWAAGARVGARLEELGVSRPSVEVETVDALERSPAGKLQVVVAARAPSAG